MDILRKSEVPHGSWKARLKCDWNKTISLHQVYQCLIFIGWRMDSHQPKFNMMQKMMERMMDQQSMMMDMEPDKEGR